MLFKMAFFHREYSPEPLRGVTTPPFLHGFRIWILNPCQPDADSDQAANTWFPTNINKSGGEKACCSISCGEMFWWLLSTMQVNKSEFLWDRDILDVCYFKKETELKLKSLEDWTRHSEGFNALNVHWINPSSTWKLQKNKRKMLTRVKLTRFTQRINTIRLLL